MDASLGARQTGAAAEKKGKVVVQAVDTHPQPEENRDICHLVHVEEMIQNEGE